jgi:hypothetical protein
VCREYRIKIRQDTDGRGPFFGLDANEVEDICYCQSSSMSTKCHRLNMVMGQGVIGLMGNLQQIPSIGCHENSARRTPIP